MHEGTGVLIAFLVFILGGVVLMIVAMNNRRKMLEIAHRERVAMIERGLVPAPETDPAGFEAGSGLANRRGSSAERYRTAGVILIGLGLSLMVLLTFAASEPDIGVGVGGAWAILGGACLLNYFLMSRRDLDRLSAGNWRPPTPREPPARGPTNAGP